MDGHPHTFICFGCCSWQVDTPQTPLPPLTVQKTYCRDMHFFFCASLIGPMILFFKLCLGVSLCREVVGLKKCKIPHCGDCPRLRVWAASCEVKPHCGLQARGQTRMLARLRSLESRESRVSSTCSSESHVQQFSTFFIEIWRQVPAVFAYAWGLPRAGLLLQAQRMVGTQASSKPPPPSKPVYCNLIKKTHTATYQK